MQRDLNAFLKSEYEQAGEKLVVIHLWERGYIIPFVYVRDRKDYRKAFLVDLFDFQIKDYQLYKKSHIPVRYILWSNGAVSHRLIVPFELRETNISAQEIAERIFRRVDKTYYKAVRLAAKLAAAYPDRRFQTLVSTSQIKKMQKAYYEYQLKSERDETNYITKKLGTFFSMNAQKVSFNINSMSISDLKLKVKRWGLRRMLSATVSAAVYNAVIRSEESENEPLS